MDSVAAVFAVPLAHHRHAALLAWMSLQEAASPAPCPAAIVCAGHLVTRWRAADATRTANDEDALSWLKEERPRLLADLSAAFEQRACVSAPLHGTDALDAVLLPTILKQQTAEGTLGPLWLPQYRRAVVQRCVGCPKIRRAADVNRVAEYPACAPPASDTTAVTAPASGTTPATSELQWGDVDFCFADVVSILYEASFRGEMGAVEVAMSISLFADCHRQSWMTRTQMARAANSFGEKLTDAEVEEMFEEADPNGTDVIDIATFVRLCFR